MTHKTHKNRKPARGGTRSRSPVSECPICMEELNSPSKETANILMSRHILCSPFGSRTKNLFSHIRCPYSFLTNMDRR